MSQAVFLDRDGTIIADKNYMADPAEIELLPGAVQGLRRLQDAGLLLIIVTNQSGVARGFFTEQALHEVHRRLLEILENEGVRIAGIHYCPHGPEDGCPCRKPKPGLLLDAAAEHGIDLHQSAMVGDSLRDAQAGMAAGCGLNILLGTAPAAPGCISAPDLPAAAERILAWHFKR
jgi:D-glycero-D-manno-heptose 1,7-bisphosphate phosphatase